MNLENSDDEQPGGRTPAGSEARFPEPLACPTGRYSFSDLSAYLQLRTQLGEIPFEVVAHLDTCQACESTWDFLGRTDPLLDRYRKERIGLVLRDVRTVIPQSAGSRLESEEIESVRLAESRSETRPEEFPDDLESIVRVCQEVGYIRNISERAQQAIRVARHYQEKLQVDDGNLDTVNSLIEAEEPLTLEGSPARDAVNVLAGLPVTSMSDESVMEVASPGRIVFYPARLRTANSKYRDTVGNLPSARKHIERS